MKSLARHMEEAGVSVVQLVAATRLHVKLVKAIMDGNYTPSPSQRQRLAAALGVSADEISEDTRLRFNTGAATGRKAAAKLEW
jgi:ribosome-binding protein aMBF1 (putative translation factor)